MRTNLMLLLFLCSVGVFVVTDVGQGAQSSPVEVVPEVMLNHSTSDNPVAGVRYVYIQFPGDASKVVQLQELSGVINNRIVEYNNIPAIDTGDTGASE